MKNPLDAVHSGRFVVPWYVISTTTLVMALLGSLMIIASESQRLVAAKVACTVTDVTAGNERITAALVCHAPSGEISTSTDHTSTVLAIIRRQLTSIDCDVMASGRARNCQLPAG